MPFTIKTHKFLYYTLNVLITLIEFFLGFRILLKLLAANPSPFVNWIYTTSQSLMSPFDGMFDNFVTEGGRVLEFSVVFAVIFYALMYYFFVRLLVLVADVVQKNNQSSIKQVRPQETNKQSSS